SNKTNTNHSLFPNVVVRDWLYGAQGLLGGDKDVADEHI
ncbi:hypothetical protein FB477_001867, partial [Trueperella pyogenes]|nr:hypothetical protein [Trueperella pyogenes]